MYLSTDPIGLEGGLRPHSYVHNPNTWIDPLGLAPCGGGTPKSKIPAEEHQNFTNQIMRQRRVDGTEIFYRYHGSWNRVSPRRRDGSPGFSYVTNKKYSSEKELRDDLALLEAWGVDITHVTTFRPARGTIITEGQAAHQIDGKTHEFRRGGGYQGLIKSNDLPKSSIVRTDRVNFE